MATTQLPPWLLVQATTGLAVAYTSPNDTGIRSAAIATTIALGIIVQLDALVPGRDMPFVGPMAAMNWVNVLNGIELSLLSRVSYPAQVEWEKKVKNTSPGNDSNPGPVTSRLAWAFWMPYNYRRVQTPWQIKQLPCFKRSDPGFVPSRSEFLRRCAGKMFVCALLVPLFTVDLQYPGLEEQLAILWGGDVDNSRVSVSVSPARRLLVQTSFMIPFLVLTRSVIVGLYSTGALLMVSLGITEPALWPPISGSFIDAWSIARLWGYVVLVVLSPLIFCWLNGNLTD